MTVVMNHDTNAAVWAGAWLREGCPVPLFRAADRGTGGVYPPRAGGRLPLDCLLRGGRVNAERRVDPFHAVSWATEILDEERRKAQGEEARKTAKEAPKRGRGRPPKGEEAAHEKKRRRN